MGLAANVMDDLVSAPNFLPEALTTKTGNADQSLQDRLIAALQERIGLDRYDLWFDRKTNLSIEGRSLTVETQNAFAANWIRGKFSDDLRAAAADVLKCDVDVRIQVGTPVATEQAATRSETNETPSPVFGTSSPAPATNWACPANASVMNSRFTLEEFVVGPSNQMAYHAAAQVAQEPGKQFNPLFLHGNCGLGKTHLLQGICHRFAKLHPGKKWLYLTAEQFTNEFLESIKTHKTEAFRRRIRSAELLVIDDVHFLGNKKATQEEFLHSFNQVDASGKQVVLASDCAPRQIHSLSDQLSSRFVSGMVLRVDSPDLPTRLEILRRRVLRNNWNISDAVLMHIAQSNSSSVRELEGMLLQVVAGITLINAGSTDAHHVVASIKDRTAMRGPIPTDRIVTAVAEYFSLTPAALMGVGREKNISLARAIAMYLARRHTGMSYPEIGRSLGNKNHSTVIAACQRIEGLVSGSQVLSWTTPAGLKNKAVADALHDLETIIRRTK